MLITPWRRGGGGSWSRLTLKGPKTILPPQNSNFRLIPFSLQATNRFWTFLPLHTYDRPCHVHGCGFHTVLMHTDRFLPKKQKRFSGYKLTLCSIPQAALNEKTRTAWAYKTSTLRVPSSAKSGSAWDIRWVPQMILTNNPSQDYVPIKISPVDQTVLKVGQDHCVI